MAKRKISDDPCINARCGWYDRDFGCCTCPPYENWYQCPLEPKPTEEDFMTEAELKARSEDK